MKRKILDVTVICIACICLIVTANIEEKSAGRTSGNGRGGMDEAAMPDEIDAPVAGVCRTLSDYSFTTESDEKTEISKKQITLVTIPEHKDSDIEVAKQDREDDQEAAAAETESAKTELMPEKAVAETEEAEADAAKAVEAEPVEAETESAEAEADAAEPVEAETESAKTEAEFAEDDVVPAGLAEPAQATTAQNRWSITLTQDEIELLAKIVWLESRGEPVEGQEAVVEVVFNRMTSGKFPTTVYEVLSQGNPVQFCSWKNRDYAEPTEKEYQSIQNVLDGKTSILRNDTLYFSTEPLTPRVDRRIGGHSFCY